ANEISRVINDNVTLVTSTGQNPDSDPAGSSVLVHNSISDSVTLSGGYNPDTGATLTFEAFAPGSDCASDSAAYTSDPQALTDNGDATYSAGSGDFTAEIAGDYVWVVSYSGNDTNNAVDDQGCPNADKDEISHVITAKPTIATVLSDTSVPVGSSVNDTSTLSD